MKQFIRNNIVAAYLTDADGNPTEIDILDWLGESLVSGDTIAPPNAFATNQWSLTTGSSPREITVNVSVLPANNGAEITGIDYSIDGAAWVALTGAGTGPRTITAAAAGTSYDIRLRSRNMAGASDPSAAKSVTSGAPAATSPAAFAAGDWAVSTGDGAAEIDLNITELPSNGGSAITALEYRIGAGAWTALSGTGTGARTLTMAAADTSYSINLRAVNAVGPGAASTAKTATSGEVAPTPALTATLSPNPPVAEQLLTITFSAAPDTTTATLDGAAVTLTGTGTTRTVTPATDGTLVITFAKAGYTASPITVEVQPVGSEPDLSVETVDGTPVVAGNGDVTWTITAPAEYAGTHTMDQSAEYSGPLNIGYTETTAPQCVVPAAIYRHAGPGTADNHYPGTSYRRTLGLWQVSDGPSSSQTGEWYEDGAATGYTGYEYVRAGTGLVDFRETCSVADQASRTAVSNAIEGEALAGTETLFVGVPDGKTLESYSDAAGRSFAPAAGGVNGRQSIYAPYLRRTTNVSAYLPMIASDVLGPDQEAYCRIRFPEVFTSPADFVATWQGPAVRIAGSATSADGHSYCAYLAVISNVLRYYLRRSASSNSLSSGVDLWTSGGLVLADLAGEEVKLAVRAEGDQVTLLLNDVAQHTATDADPLVGNFAGIVGRGNTTGLTVAHGLYAFDCRSL